MTDQHPQPTSDPVEIERAVAEYFSRLFRWLTPLGVALVALALVAATTTSDRGGSQTAAETSNGVGSSNVNRGAAQQTSATVANQAVTGSSGAAGPATGSAGPSDGSAGAAAADAGGVSRTGISCVGAARQVTWSKYAPPCVAAFSGDNGGGTSPGVTGDTITIVVGFGNTAENSAVQSLAGPATPNDGTWAATIEAYAKYFNTQFETYGRQVVVKTYQMKSDYVLADMGRDTAAAQADAQASKDLGAFIDLTALTNTSSLPYGNALAELGVINWSFPLRTADDYASHAPYMYNFLPDGSKWAKWAANLVCQRMAGLPASFAGGQEQGKPRKFGVIGVEIPQWKAAADLTRSLVSQQCGIDTDYLTYEFDLGKFSQYGASMMAKMHQDGVTTILCVCDPLGPIFMTQSATDDQYYPEWIYHNQGIVDSNYDSAQLAHSFSNGPALPAATQTEAFQTYRLAYPGADPPDRPYFTWIYGIMMQVFSAIQMAGPNLSPTTFQQGMASLPRSDDGGDYGPWFGDPSQPYGGVFTPWTGMQVTRWSPTAPSPDGSSAGYWFPCTGNVFYPFADLSAWGAPGTQLDC